MNDFDGIIGRFIERGGNFIDTADAFTNGRSEEIVGAYVADKRARRDRIVIAAKFFRDRIAEGRRGSSAGREEVISQCEQSLRRLKTDHIDLYWLHFGDKRTPIEETLSALDHLVHTGKVRYVGFADTPVWKVAQAQTTALLRGMTPLIALQIEYSLIERAVESELIPAAIELGLGVTPWSPFRSGALSDEYMHETAGSQGADRGEWVESSGNERTSTILDVLRKTAHELDTTPARVALAWVIAQRGVSSTIIGARTPAHVDDNLAALDVKLRPKDLATLDAVSRPMLNFSAEFLRNAVALPANAP